ncbi:MAG: LLM class flavin-dependent oxidoreductase [Candidatus Dormibacteraceae bacterium]
MRYAISIPQFFADGAFDPAGFRAYLRRAEELRFESAWTQEQVLGTIPSLSPLEAMTYAAACTAHLRIGCTVFVTPLHLPVHLAKSLASLDQLSRGRLEIGIGTGGRRPAAAYGLDGEHVVGRFTEGLRLMKALWTEDRVTFPGRFWELDGAAMEPKPFQKPYPPIWFGANHPDALRRTARLADGFFGAGSTTTERFAEQVPVLRQALAEIGRDPTTFPIAKRVYIGVDDSPERARQRVGEGLHQIYSAHTIPGLEAVAVAGTAEECVDGVRRVIEAGAERILFTTVFDEAEQMERLAADVIPRLG